MVWQHHTKSSLGEVHIYVTLYTLITPRYDNHGEKVYIGLLSYIYRIFYIIHLPLHICTDRYSPMPLLLLTTTNQINIKVMMPANIKTMPLKVWRLYGEAELHMQSHSSCLCTCCWLSMYILIHAPSLHHLLL